MCIRDRVTGEGTARVVTLLSSDGVPLATDGYDETERVSEWGWTTLTFGQYLSIKLGSATGESVELSMLDETLFDGSRAIVLAWP